MKTLSLVSIVMVLVSVATVHARPQIVDFFGGGRNPFSSILSSIQKSTTETLSAMSKPFSLTDITGNGHAADTNGQAAKHTELSQKPVNVESPPASSSSSSLSSPSVNTRSTLNADSASDSRNIRASAATSTGSGSASGSGSIGTGSGSGSTGTGSGSGSAGTGSGSGSTGTGSGSGSTGTGSGPGSTRTGSGSVGTGSGSGSTGTGSGSGSGLGSGSGSSTPGQDWSPYGPPSFGNDDPFVYKGGITGYTSVLDRLQQPPQIAGLP